MWRLARSLAQAPVNECQRTYSSPTFSSQLGSVLSFCPGRRYRCMLHNTHSILHYLTFPQRPSQPSLTPLNDFLWGTALCLFFIIRVFYAPLGILGGAGVITWETMWGVERGQGAERGETDEERECSDSITQTVPLLCLLKQVSKQLQQVPHHTCLIYVVEDRKERQESIRQRESCLWVFYYHTPTPACWQNPIHIQRKQDWCCSCHRLEALLQIH